MHWKKDPVLHRYSSNYGHLDLDLELMRQAVAIIGKTQDFRAVCRQPDLYKNTICNIMDCQIYVDELQGRLRFSITANRFLRGMIRFCVFFLLEVGTKKMSLEEMQAILNQKKFLGKKKLAYPNGLFLSKVQYPFIQFEEKHQLIKMLKVGLENQD